MNGTVSWHDHIRPCEKVLENVWLVDLLQDLIVMLDLVHVFELEFCLPLSFFCLPLSLLLLHPCLIGLFPGCILRLFFHVHHYLTVHDFTLAISLLDG